MDPTTELIPYETGKLYTPSLDIIHPNPRQPRRTMDLSTLAELSAAIATFGVIEPIIVRLHPEKEGELMIVAGERRVAAARQAGHTTIPAIVIDGNYAEIALIENITRENLTPVEEAEGLRALTDEHQYTMEKLSAVIGKSPSYLCETLSITKLPPEVRDDCRGDRAISKNTLIELAKKKQPRGMISAYNAYKAKLQAEPHTRQKKDPNDPQEILDLQVKVMNKIQTLDTSAWSEEDKNNFRTNLTNLQQVIEKCLQTLPPVAPA